MAIFNPQSPIPNPHSGLTTRQSKDADHSTEVQTFTSVGMQAALLPKTDTGSLLDELPYDVLDNIFDQLSEDKSSEAKEALGNLAKTNEKFNQLLEIRSINDPTTLVSKTYSSPEAQKAQKAKLLDMLKNGYDKEHGGEKYHVTSGRDVYVDMNKGHLKFTCHPDEDIRDQSIAVLKAVFTDGFDLFEIYPVVVPLYEGAVDMRDFQQVETAKVSKYKLSGSFSFMEALKHPDQRVVAAAEEAKA